MAEFWTRRALQREGFSVVEEEAGDAIVIGEQAGRPIWVLDAGGTGRQYNSIAALLEALDHLRLP